MKMKYTLTLMATAALFSGCQLMTPETATSTPAPSKQQPSTVKNPNAVPTPEGVKITPYDRPEIRRDPLAVKVPVQRAQSQPFEDGHQLPAFRNLIQQTRNAAQQKQWPQVERFAMDAQRLAPQAAEPFYYLSLAALSQQRAASAESLARRGLSYAQTDGLKKQLWQIIRTAGQQQGKNNVVQEAQQHLN